MTKESLVPAQTLPTETLASFGGARSGSKVIDPSLGHAESFSNASHCIAGALPAPASSGESLEQLLVIDLSGWRRPVQHDHVLTAGFDLGATIQRLAERPPPELLMEFREFTTQSDSTISPTGCDQVTEGPFQSMWRLVEQHRSSLGPQLSKSFAAPRSLAGKKPFEDEAPGRKPAADERRHSR